MTMYLNGSVEPTRRNFHGHQWTIPPWADVNQVIRETYLTKP